MKKLNHGDLNHKLCIVCGEGTSQEETLCKACFKISKMVQYIPQIDEEKVKKFQNYAVPASNNLFLYFTSCNNF